MGSALVCGVQENGVIACVKHFAFNSMENARFKVSIECDKRTEREIFLSHFKDKFAYNQAMREMKGLRKINLNACYSCIFSKQTFIAVIC